MTDQEIDKWVEEHLICPREGVARIDYNQLSDVLLRWGKLVAKKFYKLGKDEN
jgi:hypothetical protein